VLIKTIYFQYLLKIIIRNILSLRIYYY